MSSDDTLDTSYAAEMQKKSSTRLSTGYPAPKKRVPNNENPIEIFIQKNSLPPKKISLEKKRKIQQRIVKQALITTKPEQPKNKINGKHKKEKEIENEQLHDILQDRLSIYNSKKILYGMESVFETINMIDHEVLVASQQLRISNDILEHRNKSYEELQKNGYAEIDELNQQIKDEKREYKEKKLKMQQESELKLKKKREGHSELTSNIESKIERQIRWRKFQWLPETDAFSGQIDALIDLLSYTQEKFEKDKSTKISTLGNVIAASKRTVESLKLKFSSMDSQFKKEIAVLTNRINAIQGKSESLQNKNEDVEKRIQAYQQQREAEENELCDHLNTLYRDLVEAQQDRLVVARQKRDILKQMTMDSSNQLSEAKQRLQKLRDAVIPRNIEKNDFDELAVKARIRIAKIILQQMKDENSQLKQDLALSTSISSQMTQISSISDV